MKEPKFFIRDKKFLVDDIESFADAIETLEILLEDVGDKDEEKDWITTEIQILEKNKLILSMFLEK